MNAAERRRILGDHVIEHIRQQVADAPAPSPEVIDVLRRIFTRPAAAPTAEPSTASDSGRRRVRAPGRPAA